MRRTEAIIEIALIPSILWSLGLVLKENIGKCVDWSVKGGNWKEDTIIDTNTMIRRNRKENHWNILLTRDFWKHLDEM